MRGLRLTLFVLAGGVDAQCTKVCGGLKSCDQYSLLTCSVVAAWGCSCPACSKKCQQQGATETKMETTIEYDYVVVGGGAAGCAAAKSLAEAGYSTIVLERGINDDEAPSTQAGGDYGRAVNDEKLYEPFRFTDGVWGGVAKVLGGGSALNAGIWIEEMDDFFYNAQLQNHLPGIREKYDDLSALLAQPSPQTFDPLAITSKLAFTSGLGDVTFQPLLFGPSRQLQEDTVFNVYTTTTVETRTGASILCKDPDLIDFLDIATETTVERVLIGPDLRATGVRATTSFFQPSANATVVDIMASRGVVMAAGVIYTPTILMHSGIGPSEELDKVMKDDMMRIENDAIGQNFIDRPSAPRSISLASPVNTYLGSVVASSENLYECLGGQGVLGQALATGLAVFPAADRSPALRSFFLDLFEAAPCVESFIDDGAVVVALLANPLSRGNITLDPDTLTPIVNANAFDDPRDVAAMIDARETVDEILNASAWAPLVDNNRSVTDYCPPGAVDDALMAFLQDFMTSDGIALPSDENVTPESLRAERTTTWHYFGTASLGSVVDPATFQVLGVDRLHVVDASIFPVPTRTNPQATIMAVAAHAGSTIAQLYADPLPTPVESPDGNEDGGESSKKDSSEDGGEDGDEDRRRRHRLRK